MKRNVKFKKASFRYPTQPEVRVLRDLDLSVTSGHALPLFDLFDDLLVKKYFVLTHTESLGRKC